MVRWLEEDPDTVGERVLEQVVVVAGGAVTHCEALSELQLSMSRFGLSV